MHDKIHRTMKLRCCGKTHRISLTTKGRVLIHDHTKEDFARENNFVSLGGQASMCIALMRTFSEGNPSTFSNLGFTSAIKTSKHLSVAWRIQQRRRRQADRQPAEMLNGKSIINLPHHVAIQVGFELKKRGIVNWLSDIETYRGDNSLRSGEMPATKEERRKAADDSQTALLSAYTDGRGPIIVNTGCLGAFVTTHKIMTEDKGRIDIDTIADSVELSHIHKQLIKAADRNEKRTTDYLVELQKRLAKTIAEIAPLSAKQQEEKEAARADYYKNLNAKPQKPTTPEWPAIRVTADTQTATYSLNLEFEDLTFPGVVQSLERLTEALRLTTRTAKSNFDRLQAANRFPPKPQPGIG